MIKISSIKIGQQARVEVNQDKVAEYAAHLEYGGTFPGVILFYDGKHYWLADGHHRLLAHKRIGYSEILETVHVGGERDALAFALGANRDHGLPRTVADKRNAVYIALADVEWSKLSDVKIASMCAVTQPFVSKVRHELAGTSKPKKQPNPKHEKVEGGITVIPPPVEVVDSKGGELEKEENRYDPKEDALSEAHDTVVRLHEENQRLKDAIAVGELPESEQSAGEIIAELRSRIKVLEATLDAVTISRDTFQRENAQMMKQCAMQKKKLDILEAK